MAKKKEIIAGRRKERLAIKCTMSETWAVHTANKKKNRDPNIL